MKRKFSQKGVSLYLAVVIITIILAIVLGLTTILIDQIKIIRGMGHSVVAFYAADTGVEQVLKVVIDCLSNNNCESVLESSYPDSGETSLDNNSSYRVEVVCCDPSVQGCEFASAGNFCNDYCKTHKYEKGVCREDSCDVGETHEPLADRCCRLPPPRIGKCCCSGTGLGVCPTIIDPDCEATYFCIRSVGTFENTQRAIEVEMYPSR